MRIVFRTDASVQIGTGHVMRCLTLADALNLNGAKCTFICRAHSGHLIDVIHRHGHQTVLLPTQDKHPTATNEASLAHSSWLGTGWATDAAQTQEAIRSQATDWLVVDHYALDYRWEEVLRPHCRQLMVIDDLADRRHDCDLLLDQNLGRRAKDYDELIPFAANKLIGPRYALLRPEFAELRAESLARRTHPELKHLLITMGGVDKDNVTGDVLDALLTCALPTDLHITVVMGSHAPWLDNVKSNAHRMPCPTNVLVNVKHMARLMTDSDLVIAAPGGTAWELCSLGLPSVALVIAENQQGAAKALAEKKAVLLCKSPNELASLMNGKFVQGNGPSLLQQLSNSAAAITQGTGISLVINSLGGIHA